MLKCRDCKECNGIACRGEIPGVGGKDTGRSFIRNYEAWNEIKLNMNVCVDSHEISTRTNILGLDLSFPLFVAPVAGIKNNYGHEMSDYDYNALVLDACDEVGVRAFTGDGIDIHALFEQSAHSIHDHQGHGIVTMKPWVKEGIDARLDLLKEIQYDMLATDIDAAGLPLLRAGKTPVETKNAESLRYLKQQSSKKLIVKGIMTVEAALVALEAGADGIVVSNHGGRVLDGTPGTAEVLPEIVEAVGDRMTILVDGGIRSGMDIFKALALGASGVLVGRPVALAACKGEKEGVVGLLQKYQDQLSQTMLMTGCHKIQDINLKCLHK